MYIHCLLRIPERQPLGYAVVMAALRRSTSILTIRRYRAGCLPASAPYWARAWLSAMDANHVS